MAQRKNDPVNEIIVLILGFISGSNVSFPPGAALKSILISFSAINLILLCTKGCVLTLTVTQVAGAANSLICLIRPPAPSSESDRAGNLKIKKTKKI